MAKGLSGLTVGLQPIAVGLTPSGLLILKFAAVYLKQLPEFSKKNVSQFSNRVYKLISILRDYSKNALYKFYYQLTTNHITMKYFNLQKNNFFSIYSHKVNANRTAYQVN